MLITCYVCGNQRNKSPSKIFARPCCSRECQIKLARKDIVGLGRQFRYRKGEASNPPEFYESLKLILGNENNYAWKGGKVSYRGLHQWVRRKKGHPNECSKCGKQSEKPRIIQWANIDGKYRRVLEDYIAMCCSCHKFHDIKLKKSNQDEIAETR